MLREQSGFTLIELILVTVIIAILASAVTLSVAGRSEEARVARTQSDISVYQNAIDLYALDHNDQYPSSLQDLVGGEREYVRKLEKDPWGNEYIYVVPGKQNQKSYDLYSVGPDGQPGTADDITNWN